MLQLSGVFLVTNIDIHRLSASLSCLKVTLYMYFSGGLYRTSLVESDNNDTRAITALRKKEIIS